MPASATPDPTLKLLVKEAVKEALHDQRDWLQDVVAEVLEELALDEALREVEAAERLQPPPVFRMAEGEA